MNVYDVFADVDFSERTTNYIALAKNIADDYGYDQSPLSAHLAHGIQKDAIQNGWDAKEKDTHKYISDNWGFDFELLTLDNGTRVLTMTDRGTTGLTGNLTSTDLKAKNMAAEDLPAVERWARWESLGFTKNEGLGARGQGKMIFMHASKDHTIYYDSLRSDKTYKFGGSIATETGCPVASYNADEAGKAIKKKLGLEPLSVQGTRMIIVEPQEEVIQDIQNDDFIRFIEQTWWPIIHKYGVSITVKYGGKIYQAKVPDMYPLTKDDTETDTFKTWVKEEDVLKKQKIKLKIKRLCFACDLNNEADELYQGIACFRGGMMVDVVTFPSKAFRNKVFGYIEFDKELEDELRTIERPTHYAFNNRNPWRQIKSFIEQELEAFGNNKLGLAIDSNVKTNIRRSSAESKALSILRAVIKDWPMSRLGKGGGGGGGGSNVVQKRVGVRLSNLIFPNPGNVPRIDYGQKLEGFKIVAFNNTENAYDVTLNAAVLSGNRILEQILKKKFKLEGKSEKVFDNNIIEVDSSSFEDPGEYKLRLLLDDDNTHTRIDRVVRRFWVETDPRLPAPFDVRRLNFIDMPESLGYNKSSEWILYDEGDGTHTLYYNQQHPAYLSNDTTESELVVYLSEIFLMGAVELFIKQSTVSTETLPENKEYPIDLNILKSAQPLQVYREQSLALSKIRESIYRYM